MLGNVSKRGTRLSKKANAFVDRVSTAIALIKISRISRVLIGKGCTLHRIVVIS